jgi:hypothetical protein
MSLNELTGLYYLLSSVAIRSQRDLQMGTDLQLGTGHSSPMALPATEVHLSRVCLQNLITRFRRSGAVISRLHHL